jgi:uncharacterized membrane protein YoaT (DUF817 family)
MFVFVNVKMCKYLLQIKYFFQFLMNYLSLTTHHYRAIYRWKKLIRVKRIYYSYLEYDNNEKIPMKIDDNERQFFLFLRSKLSSRIIIWRNPIEGIRFKGVKTPGGLFLAPKAKGK